MVLWDAWHQYALQIPGTDKLRNHLRHSIHGLQMQQRLSDLRTESSVRPAQNCWCAQTVLSIHNLQEHH